MNLNQAEQDALSSAATKLVDEAERTHFRRIQRASIACALRCMDTMGDAPADKLQACTARCQVPVVTAQAKLDEELDALEARLEGCFKDCSSMWSKVTSGKGANSCPMQCIDEHMTAGRKRIDEVLSGVHEAS